MKMSYMARVQANLTRREVIKTDYKSGNVLEGTYESLFKGKSMEFDELREYVMGDEVNDIDWKASSRSRRFLVRQYIAEKKHNVLFVLDTNRRMLAASSALEEKKDVALMCAGTMAYFVNHNNDYIGALYSGGGSVSYMPLKTGMANVERILEGYDHAVKEDNRSSMNDTIDYMVRNLKKRMIVVIITDLEGAYEISEQNLKRLKAACDVMFITVSDVSLEGDKLYDMLQDSYMDDFFLKDKKLNKLLKEKRAELEAVNGRKLNRLGITNTIVHSVSGLGATVGELLERHRLGG